MEEILIILSPPAWIKNKSTNCPKQVKLESIETVAKPVTQTPLNAKNIESIKDNLPQKGNHKTKPPNKQRERNVIAINLTGDFIIKSNTIFFKK